VKGKSSTIKKGRGKGKGRDNENKIIEELQINEF
jgi:hypothetical protein